MDAARAAFEALPLDDRKAIQDDLVWASTYSGTLDGGFGAGTYAAIGAVQQQARKPATGILSAPERAALAASAKAAREAYDFRSLDDARTGARLKLPMKLLDGTVARPAGTIWSSKTQPVSVATELYRIDITGLAPLFEKFKADVPGRKVTYAVLRTDWFVVVAEAGTRRSYTRFVAGPPGAAGPVGIVGYTFAYDAALPNGDRLAVAIANGFEPFPAAKGPIAPADVAKAVATQVVKPDGSIVPGPATAVTPTTSVPVPPAPNPPKTATAPVGAPPATTAPALPTARPAGTGLVVAPGRVLTAASLVETCPVTQPEASPATILFVVTGPANVIAKSGDLALLEVVGVPAPAGLGVAGGAPEPETRLVALIQAATAGKTALSVSAGQVSSAADGTPRLVTAYQNGTLGAPAFDANGALAGIILPTATPPRISGTILPDLAQPLASGPTIAEFLATNGTMLPAGNRSAGVKTAGGIVAQFGAAVVPVVCVSVLSGRGGTTF